MIFDPQSYRIIDLTLPYDELIRGFSRKTARTLEHDGWNALDLEIYSHAGTHMDAPLHFGLQGPTIDQISPSTFFCKTWIVDVVVKTDRQLIDLSAIQNLEKKLESGEGMILRTGWSKHVGTDYYRDALPRVSPELAQWCADREVSILGVEPPSVADVNNLQEVTEIHHILLGGGVVILEGLTNLDQLTTDEVQLVALPLKIKGGDGAPTRVMAFEKIN